MTAMNLSKEDGNRDFYDEFFKKAAFVLKENEELRYKPPVYEDPNPDLAGNELTTTTVDVPSSMGAIKLETAPQ